MMLAVAVFLAALSQLWLHAPTGVSGAVHSLFVGNLMDPALMYSLVFDDETHSLNRAETITAEASHAWITFDHSKTNIYGASLNKPFISSYALSHSASSSPTNNSTTPLHVSRTRTVAATGACAKTTSAFVEALPYPPYTVYTVSWPGPDACGMAISVDATGALDTVLQSWHYSATSGVHGLALGRSNKGNDTLLYSADLSGDAVWTHRVDGTTGKVREVGRRAMKRAGMHPRHVRVGGNGRWVYVVMEAANSVVGFEVDGEDGVEFSLIPAGMLFPSGIKNKKKGYDTKNYWSAEVMLSPSGRYLWATARSQQKADVVGYISVFLLAADGAIVKRMFMVPTTTKGGWANAIRPAFWSDEYAAMTDTPTGYVQIWKLDGPKETEHGVVEYRTAKAVARVDLNVGNATGCCANAIWYS
ncbi:Lactonase, 7-bladed beta-propeller-domain-containing protein [Bombardia bombarda]|uniref:Lactonase, 7-bladed beta-propeller-domain-containing protein n=1 Tax=Bombardia bombarda TaxID=252184 RepID=A0AA39WGZ6_9PEZI|nr:Lactonase, 7-bladed beta-propeller-domain-containing protein [Bombardia bombarda]